LLKKNFKFGWNGPEFKNLFLFKENLVKQLSFESENLAVNYITLNVRNLVNPEQIEHIINVFAESFNFNVWIRNASDKHFSNSQIKEENLYEVYFVRYSYSPQHRVHEITISFSGEHAKHFYKIWKDNTFFFEIFENLHVNLGRFDLCYFREAKTTDQIDQLQTFLKDCQSKVAKNSF
jgi:hypothetical protein